MISPEAKKEIHMPAYSPFKYSVEWFSDRFYETFTGPKKATQTFIAMLAALFTASAFALAVPQVGDLGYAIYDTVVNQILSGPIGFVGGVLLIVLGAVNVTKSWMLAVGCVISGSAVIQADTIVTSLGLPLGLI
jgi:hypothetical protein